MVFKSSLATSSGGEVVTSVSLSMPTEFNVVGSPVTSSGTFVVTKANENANTVYAGPVGGTAGAPAFRALVAADLPFTTGTYASMPAAGTLGSQYFCTDTSSLYFDTGSAWVPITPPPGTSQKFYGSIGTGYVAMDGTAYSTTASQYLALYQVIGHTFDTWRGQTSPGTGFFRVPQINGLTEGATGATVAGGSITNPSTSTRSLADLYGEETHLQASSELAPHLHTYLETFVGGYVPTKTSGGSSAVGSISPLSRNTGTTPSATQTAFNVIQPTAYANFGIKL